MDFYLVLGLERTATLGDVKRAYKRLARRLHPDINPGDRRAAAQFRQVLEAYETLSDPDRRRLYDTTGPTSATIETATFGFQGFDFSSSVTSQPMSTFGDLFGDILVARGRQPAQGPERGSDLHHTITVSFEDAVRGGPRELTVTRFAACASCSGTGKVETAERRCLYCQGSGSLTTSRGHMVFSRPCHHCGGSGRHAETRCAACNGQRGQMTTEPLSVNFPPGLADGARIRVPHKGHAGSGGGEAGDLYVTVRVGPHPFFRRDGDDVHVTVPVAVHEAALGARIDVPSIDGTTRIRIPPGTQSGRRFRFRERGIPSRAGHRGDLIVEVQVVLPAVLDERSKELMREFGRINNEDVRHGLKVSSLP